MPGAISVIQKRRFPTPESDLWVATGVAEIEVHILGISSFFEPPPTRQDLVVKRAAGQRFETEERKALLAAAAARATILAINRIAQSSWQISFPVLTTRAMHPISGEPREQPQTRLLSSLA